ncbi:hypothetical protein DFH28DRAFT_1090416 [Melampsora americana]|nr:hypothetical protein DFH28DRAFT_1090416 [Melampsora americana]
MPESLSMQPAGTPFIGPMNELLEPPDERVGDDRGATSNRLKQLYCIFTNKEVDIDAPTDVTAKVVAGKKQPKTIKLNLIDSTAINSKYLDFKACLFGKSLNEFKILCADRSELYEGGMKTIILDCAFSPDLKWKASVGRFKTSLDDGEKWQGFVTALEKSVKKFGTVSIENDNLIVKFNVEAKVRICDQVAEKATAEGKPGSQESAQDKKDAQLQTFACEVFSKHGSEGFAGGDGTILTAPWDPTFRYRLTMPACWIWAKGIMAGVASVYIPPNTADFREEIKKSEWKHPDMRHPQKLQQTKQQEGRSNSFNFHHVGGSTLKNIGSSNHNIETRSNLTIDEKPDLSKLGDKRYSGNLSVSDGPKPELKKIKVENQAGDSIEDPISVSSDSEIGSEDESDGISHSGELEAFLLDCNIPPEDTKTRALLTEAGILLWTDLIPSVQLTETTLTSKGIHRQIASRLTEAAQARYWDCKYPV